MTHSTTPHPTLHPVVAQAHCRQGQHRWHPTFLSGQVICTVCGARGACPVCLPGRPDPRIHLVYCHTHRPEEEDITL